MKVFFCAKFQESIPEFREGAADVWYTPLRSDVENHINGRQIANGDPTSERSISL